MRLNKDEGEFEGDVEMTDEELIHQPIHKKIENILPYLLIHWTSQLFKKKWVWPVKNPKYGLYEDNVLNAETKEVKDAVAKGINKLLFSKMNIKEILMNHKKSEM